jgi:hypothetical protein
MGYADPRGLHDLGSSDDPNRPYAHLEILKQELHRVFPGRRFSVFPTAAPDPSTKPVGYDAVRVSVDREASESAEAFVSIRDRVARVLYNTEDELGQPGTGAPYLRCLDSDTPAPVRGPFEGDTQAVVGWVFIVYVSRTMVRAEDIESMNQRMRGARRS